MWANEQIEGVIQLKTMKTLRYEERETTVRDRLLFHWSWVCAPMWHLCQNVKWHHFLLFCKKHMTQRQQECKKKGLISKTTTLQVHHTFLYISLPFLHHYSIVMPNFMFYGECKQATTKFYFSLWAWIWSLGIQHEFGSLHLFWQRQWVEIIATKTERT